MSKKIVISALSALRGGGQTYLINLYQMVIMIVNKNIYLWSIFRFKNNISLPNVLLEQKADIYYAPGGTMTTLRNMLPFDFIHKIQIMYF